jgi:hypothetical protein
MVITARRGADRGLRPADVQRDLRGIADLLAEAFVGELDEAGRQILREMRFWAVSYTHLTLPTTPYV